MPSYQSSLSPPNSPSFNHINPKTRFFDHTVISTTRPPTKSTQIQLVSQNENVATNGMSDPTMPFRANLSTRQPNFRPYPTFSQSDLTMKKDFKPPPTRSLIQFSQTYLHIGPSYQSSLSCTNSPSINHINPNTSN